MQLASLMTHHPQSSSHPGKTLFAGGHPDAKTVCCLAALLTTLCATAAHATSWELKPGGDNRLEFTATFEQTPVTGVFKDFRFALISTSKPGSNRLNVSIRISSADMANADINQAIAGKDWFDFVRYPEAVFDAGEILDAPAQPLPGTWNPGAERPQTAACAAIQLEARGTPHGRRIRHPPLDI
jgi:hypothetical protein